MLNETREIVMDKIAVKLSSINFSMLSPIDKIKIYMHYPTFKEMLGNIISGEVL